MTFICAGKPDYGWLDKVKKLEPDAFVRWRNGAVSMRDKIGPLATQASLTENAWHYLPDGNALMDDLEIQAWNDAGIEISVRRVKGLASNARELQQTIFQVSVANVGLLQIQCVEVLEDCCTYELQRFLDKGWRIIAVCPPNDTRRPSYVIGHMDKEPHR
jgi:hypothetical protein